jgi:ribonuclease P protein subunit RPR2
VDLALQLSVTSEESDTERLARRMGSVLAPCQELLEEALERLGGTTGVLYGVEGPRQLSLLGSCGMTAGNDEPVIERAAMAGLEASRPLVVGGRPGIREAERFLVVPCFLQGDTAAILLVGRTSESTAYVEQDLAKLGSTTSIALAADRARIHFTLEHRLAEAEGMRRQLDAYAVDLRSVYLSERARSEELGRTLVELEETYEATVRGLAIAVEAKDEYTGGHLFRVSRYGMAMTAIVAPAHRDDPQFEYGFLLHDVGKLSVPDAVLTKSGALNEEEWDFIRAHPASGRTILERIPFLAGASEIVYCHHERWDGQGFPRGLMGDEIPLGARIFPIADAFDAMTTSRPYRKAMPIEIARSELVRGSGTQFWPDAVDAFMSMQISDLEEIRSRTLGASGW